MPVDVRIICASNKDLAEEVEKGNFRQDLYYRLNVISIKIPSLRQRREDIPLLFNYMLDHIGHEWDSKVKHVDPEVMWLLKNYSWPGNVRELQNVVERIISIADGDVIKLEHLPESILNNTDNIGEGSQLPKAKIEDMRQTRKQLFEEKESQRITFLLAQFGGNISQVAKEMGVARSTLYRKMQRLNIPN